MTGCDPFLTAAHDGVRHAYGPGGPRLKLTVFDLLSNGSGLDFGLQRCLELSRRGVVQPDDPVRFADPPSFSRRHQQLQGPAGVFDTLTQMHRLLGQEQVSLAHGRFIAGLPGFGDGSPSSGGSLLAVSQKHGGLPQQKIEVAGDRRVSEAFQARELLVKKGSYFLEPTQRNER